MTRCCGRPPRRCASAGQSEAAIAAVQLGARRGCAGGDAKLIPSVELEPAVGVPLLEELPDADPAQALARLAVIKLNGGLATSMGLTRPKSLIVAREGRSFLDVIVEQTLSLRRRFGVRLPLVLMNSDVTRAETLSALRAFPELAVDGLAPDFLQSMVPKLDAADARSRSAGRRRPSSSGARPGTETSTPPCAARGCSTRCVERGFRYAMISNADNLGAVADSRIAGAPVT